MPRWAPWALVFQLVAVFFVPPIVLGQRSVFISDLWCLLWVAVALPGVVARKDFRGPLRFILGSAALLFVIFVHGKYRPLFGSGFSENYLFQLTDLEHFQPVREFVIMLRFLSWLSAGALVAYWTGRATGLQRNRLQVLISRALAACVVASVFIMAMERLVPGVKTVLAQIYGFDPAYFYWRGRSYGPFRSPIEAGAALSLCAMLLVGNQTFSLPVRRLLALVAICGVFLSQCGSAMVALTLVIIIAIVDRQISRRRWMSIALLIVVVAMGVAILLAKHGASWGKLGDFFARCQLWIFYFHRLAERIDTLLFGFGFAPYHSDNSYVFIVTRGGLTALVLVCFFALKMICEHWKSWTVSGRAVVLLLGLIGISLDAWIFRHVVTIFIAAVVPMLASRSRK